MLTLDVINLCRRFGRHRVLDRLSFQVQPGEVVGITGPNGSGKSTLLQLLAGLQRPTSGRVVYLGEREFTPREARSRLGFASPDLALYDSLSAAENLEFFARWRGIAADVPELLARVGLPPARREPLAAYSTGMRQRVKLAWALMHRPECLLLDEPGANLDADGRALVASIVDEWKRTGWVVLASNDPEELSLADRTIALAGAGAGASSQRRPG
jgi:heme exporter protein A